MERLFEFLNDFGNYADRKVDRYENRDTLVSTAKVSDGDHPFETAVIHPKYNKAKWIIVEAYDTRKEAEIGHDRWVATMTAPVLPDYLQDCQNSRVSQMLPKEHLRYPYTR